jgi:TRAP-type C4-dicarboxylate transport system permease small subunit
VKSFEKVLGSITEKATWIAMVAIVGCMLLVVSDVIKREAVIIPIPGVIEMVDLLGAVMMSMGMGYLALVKGHVDVSVLVERFPPRVRAFFDLVNSVIIFGFTILLTVGMVEFGILMQVTSQATPFLRIPEHPFIYLVAAGLALPCLVFIRDLVSAAIRIRKGGGA